VPAALLLHLSTNVVLAVVTISSVALVAVVLVVATLGAVLIARSARVSAPAPGRRPAAVCTGVAPRGRRRWATRGR
jgi:hypothetical protein